MRGIVCIRNNGHKLLCRIYNVQYDQIGLRLDNKYWIYWNLPTRLMHHMGEWKVPKQGLSISYAALREKYNIGSYDKFLSTLDAERSLSVVFRALGSALSLSRPQERTLNDLLLSIFYPPELRWIDDTHVEPICRDLVFALCNNPPPSHEEENKALLHDLTEDIVRGSLTLSTLKRVPNIEISLSSDKLILLEVDGSLRDKIMDARKRLLSLFEKEGAGEINIEDFLSLLNTILSLYGETTLKEQKPFSTLLISTGEDRLKLENRLLSVSLAGHNISLLTKEELEHLLHLMDEIQCNDERFDELRSLIVKHLYACASGNKSLER